MEIRVHDSFRQVPAESWDSLTRGNPTLRHAFLLAMEESGCAGPEAGWQGHFLTLWEEGAMVGGMPLYFKSNSWGEFVFDWAWAEAYEHHGLEYYPKLISAVPFTPITGARAMAATPERRAALIAAALELAKRTKVSSFHLLFPPEAEKEELSAQGLLLRNTVQFHWRNDGFGSFADFLATMKHEKRKKIARERGRLNEAGIECRRVRGEEISEEEWDFFYACYLHTHETHQSPPSLNRDFFARIARAMPENLLMVIAYREGKPIGSALDFYTKDVLYGRNWGAFEFHSGLHFEVCYYQGIEFCIENRIASFEGGAQGEHKLARGLTPVTTWSGHWLAHPQFFHAVENFLKSETGQIGRYVNELNQSNPFKKP